MESRFQSQITMLQCHEDQNDPHGLAGHVGARFECPCAFVSHAHCVCDCCEKEPIKKHYNNIAFLHNMIDPQTRLDNIEPSRGRETETRGLWIRAQVHETQPHEHRGAGVRARSQTLERGRALSKVSGSTRVRGGVCIARRENGKGVLRRKETKGIYTHMRGVTLSAKHNERVTGSSTGRGYVVFGEVAGHGGGAAVMLGVAPGLAIAGLYESNADPRATSPPLEGAALESTSHKEATSRQGEAGGKHHGALAGAQVGAEGTLPVTGRPILPY